MKMPMTQRFQYGELARSRCQPCEQGGVPLNAEQLRRYREDTTFKWEIIKDRKIEKDFRFESYAQAMAFANKIASLAEAEGHHPIMHIYYAKVGIELWTHAIGGLSDNDFILAAKIDQIKV